METLADNVSEVYVRGKWVRVPALECDGKTVVIRGKWLRMATIRSEEWLETELGDPERCVNMLSGHGPSGPRADIFTFTQKLPATTPKYQYQMEWESVAAVGTRSFKEWWDGLPQATRKNVRRSQKRGVVVTVRKFDDDLVTELMGLNNDSPIRQGVRNVQYGKSFEQTKRDYSSFSERSDFLCAHVGNELIGLLKIVYRGEIASILNLLGKASHYDKRPGNVLMAKAVELCESQGISHLTYGLFNYGNKRESPLREFKIRNGFGEILVPRFYVPLTRWGKLCLRAKIHRGLVGVLPHRVITLIVNARSKWYRIRYAGVAQW